MLNLKFASGKVNKNFHYRKSNEPFEHLVNYINPVHFIDKPLNIKPVFLLEIDSLF